MRLEFEAFEKLIEIEQACGAGTAFEALVDYFHNRGVASVGLCVSKLEHSPGNVNDLRCSSIEWFAFSGEDEERFGLEEYSHNALFDADGAARPYYFGNMLPYRVGSSLNRQLAREDFLKDRLPEPDYNAAQKAGMRQSWVTPTMHSLSSFTPLGSFAFHADAKTEDAIRYFDALLEQFSVLAHAYTDKVRDTVFRTYGVSKRLTQRERECLTWAALGLRPVEIAYRLDMTSHTVNFHLKSARIKFDAATLAHAVARAIALGEITP